MRTCCLREVKLETGQNEGLLSYLSWVFVVLFGICLRSERRDRMPILCGFWCMTIGLWWPDIMMGLIVYGCAYSCNHLMLLDCWRSPKKKYWNQRLVLMASWVYITPLFFNEVQLFAFWWEKMWARHFKRWTDLAHHCELLTNWKNMVFLTWVLMCLIYMFKDSVKLLCRLICFENRTWTFLGPLTMA